MSTEPQPGVAPPPDPPSETTTMTVDGHDFRVSARAGKPGTYDFDWLSGPHAYGFALSGVPGMTRAQAAENIRAFLAQINPATGYLD